MNYSDETKKCTPQSASSDAPQNSEEDDSAEITSTAALLGLL